MCKFLIKECRLHPDCKNPQIHKTDDKSSVSSVAAMAIKIIYIYTVYLSGVIFLQWLHFADNNYVLLNWILNGLSLVIEYFYIVFDLSKGFESFRCLCLIRCHECMGHSLHLKLIHPSENTAATSHQLNTVLSGN